MKNRLGLIGFVLVLLIGLGSFLLINGASGRKSNALVIPTTAPQPTIEDDSLSNEKLLKIINDWRVSQNLAPYKVSEFLCGVADIRIKEIQTEYSHKGLRAHRWCPENETCTVGENLNMDVISNQITLDSWLNSPPHRKILDSNFTHTCIRTEGLYAVQIFGYY